MKLLNDYPFHLTNEPVLILGENGVGKSRFAKIIHNNSKKHKMIHVNVNSINESLFESEFFGHVKGAFTGAERDKKGFLEDVGNGTLFLDEIGDLSEVSQVKLLHVLEEKFFIKVGCTQQVPFKGRFIFATNKNLEELVEKKKFREDLYYRLRFFEVRMRPLREKKPELKKLIESEMNILDQKGMFLKVSRKTVEAALSGYSWPGNFREFQNTIKYLSFFWDKTKTFKLPKWLTLEEKKFNVKCYRCNLERFEKSFLYESLEENDFKINQTARVLEISKTTLISKVKKYRIELRR